MIYFKRSQHVQYNYDPHVHIDYYIGMVFVDIVFDSIVDAGDADDAVPKQMQRSPQVQQKQQAKKI